MSITNKNQFPEVEFLKPPYKEIGRLGTRPLFLVGRERGFNTLLVTAGDSTKIDAEAIYLYELEKFQPMDLRVDDLEGK